MLIMAIIAALTPTLFYQMYGSVSKNSLFHLDLPFLPKVCLIPPSIYVPNSLNFDAVVVLNRHKVMYLLVQDVIMTK